MCLSLLNTGRGRSVLPPALLWIVLEQEYGRLMCAREASRAIGKSKH